jgi:hypothetical protein
VCVLERGAGIARDELPVPAVRIGFVIDDDAERTRRRHRAQDARIVRDQELAHRVLVRRAVAAEPVVERNVLERLLIQRERVAVVGHRQIEARGDAGRRRPVLGLGEHLELLRPAVEREADDGDPRHREPGPPAQPIHGQRGEHGEAQDRHHPESRRYAEAVERGQPHQPAVRRLVERAMIEDRRVGAEREHPHRERRERIERERRSAPRGVDHARQGRHPCQSDEHRKRHRLVGACDRHEPHAADRQPPRTVGGRQDRRDEQQRERRGEDPPQPPARPRRLRMACPRRRGKHREHRERRDRRSREQLSFWPSDRMHPSPEQELVGRMQQRRDVGAELLDHLEPARETVHIGEDPLVAEERRREEQGRGHEPGREPCERGDRPAADRVPEKPAEQEDAEKEKEVPVGERLHEPRARGERRPARHRPAIVPVQRGQADGRPVRRQHLDVRELRQPIRREGVRHACHERGIVPARQRVGQKVRAEPAEDVAREQRHVVPEQRVAGERDDRHGDRCFAQQVFREGQRPRRRIKDRRVPPRVGERHRLRRPPQNPRVQNRVARVVRDAVKHVPGERPGIRESEDDIPERGEREWMRLADERHVRPV